jgi:uncharacterized phage infection (PIP) family protein YhgE
MAEQNTYKGKVLLSTNFKPIVWLLENLSKVIDRINNIELEAGNKDTLDTLEKSIQNLYSYLKNLKIAMDEQDKILNDLIKSNTSGLQTQINNLKEKIDSLNNEVDNLNNLLTTANEDINNIKTDIETIKTDITNIKQSIESLNTSFNELKVSVENLKTKVESITEDITSIKARLGVCEGKINNHETRITALENNAFLKTLQIVGGIGGFDFNFSDDFDTYIELKDSNSDKEPLGDLTGAYIICEQMTDLGNNESFSIDYLNQFGSFWKEFGSSQGRTGILFHWRRDKTKEIPFEDRQDIFWMGLMCRMNLWTYD